MEAPSKSAVLLVVLVLGLALPVSADGTDTQAVVCSRDSYLPYVAVAAWAPGEPVELSLLTLSQPIGELRTIALPEEVEGPVDLLCTSERLVLRAPGVSLLVQRPASPSPSVEAVPLDEPGLDGNRYEVARFECRNGELERDPLRAPLGKYKLQPLDHSRYDEPFSFALRGPDSDSSEGRRWRFVVSEKSRDEPVGRDVTILELVCPD
ncbi:MAG: hypothetical protein R3244_04020 [Thermoanaerobaculia bacterium]|nr:hypothetical protein [Thermoanaerobaculia bacterium]